MPRASATEAKGKLKEVAVILQGRGDLSDKQKQFIAEKLWHELNEAIANIVNDPDVAEAMEGVQVVFELPEHRDFLTVRLR